MSICTICSLWFISCMYSACMWLVFGTSITCLVCVMCSICAVYVLHFVHVSGVCSIRIVALLYVCMYYMLSEYVMCLINMRCVESICSEYVVCLLLWYTRMVCEVGGVCVICVVNLLCLQHVCDVVW